jgi:hypothetical protein
MKKILFDMKQDPDTIVLIKVKGFSIERKVGYHRVSTERFQRLGTRGNLGVTRPHYEYRFANCDSPYNFWTDMGSIKWMINDPDNPYHRWFGEWERQRESRG